MSETKHGAFAPRHHDHLRCKAAALAAADRVCRDKAVRLTPIRRRVLEIVWESHKPVGAYAILEALQRDRQDDAGQGEAGQDDAGQDRAGPDGAGQGAAAIAPPTVYRALDFLRENRLVHRVESLNAYIGCAHPEERHAAHFLICLDCGSAAELDSGRLRRAVDAAAEGAGFAVAGAAIEISGRCPACQAAP